MNYLFIAFVVISATISIVVWSIAYGINKGIEMEKEEWEQSGISQYHGMDK